MFFLAKTTHNRRRGKTSRTDPKNKYYDRNSYDYDRKNEDYDRKSFDYDYFSRKGHRYSTSPFYVSGSRRMPFRSRSFACRPRILTWKDGVGFQFLS